MKRTFIRGNGSDDFAQFPSGNTNVEIGTKSLYMRVKINNDYTGNMLFFSLGTVNYAFGVSSNRTFRSYWTNFDGTTITSTSSAYLAPIDQWMDLVYTLNVDGALDTDDVDVNYKLYHDGILVDSEDRTDGANSTYGPNVILGAFSAAANFADATIQYATLYDSVLSLDQIRQLHEAEGENRLSLDGVNVVWNMNSAGYGTVTDTVTGTAASAQNMPWQTEQRQINEVCIKTNPTGYVTMPTGFQTWTDDQTIALSFKPSEFYGSDAHVRSPGIFSIGTAGAFDSHVSLSSQSGRSSDKPNLVIEDDSGNSGTTFTGEINAQINKWHRILLTKDDSGNVIVYWNGQEITTLTGLTDDVTCTYLGPGYGGATDGGLNGQQIRHVKKWSKVLNADEAYQDFECMGREQVAQDSLTYHIPLTNGAGDPTTEIGSSAGMSKQDDAEWIQG